MFGRDRTAKTDHRIKDQAVNPLFVLVQKYDRIDTHGCLHVVVQIAVAQMSEVDQTHTGNFPLQQRIGDADKFGNPRYRHRDVVFDVQTLERLCQWNALADLP